MKWLNHCAIGDCREVLKSMTADGVCAQICVTSPPYWGLRDYGTASWEGGRKGCDHKGGRNVSLGLYRDTCGKCGARRIDQQIGLEATPDEYVATMVEVFRLVREVLADDGTLWLNLGDCYAREGGVAGGGNRDLIHMEGKQRRMCKLPEFSGLKPKDLVGIPWRVAFALQADGWYLRSDIIWHKPNPMPESCKDRPTKAHEYLFLLSKAGHYYYDYKAIQEPNVGKNLSGNKERKFRVDHGGNPDLANAHQGFGVPWEGNTRNKRDVWTVATTPYSDAHFAAFPQKIVEPCILAGSRTGEIVLDPFLGSGTVAQVAQHLGRQWIGIDLNKDHVKMQQARTAQAAMLL